MMRSRHTIRNLTIFTVVTLLLTGVLFMTFGQYRTGSTVRYSAVFTDASTIQAGDTVRVAGVRVGTVNDVSLRPDKKVEVTFDLDRTIPMTTATKVAVRYLNLVGDRYLAVVGEPGAAPALAPGSEIPPDRTVPALDLDMLIGGLKPVIQGLNPKDVNALTTSLLRVLQGQGGSLQSLLSETSSFTTAVADSSEVAEQLIDNLRALLATLARQGDDFSASVRDLDRLVTEWSQERNATAAAVDALDRGTASLTDLLGDARQPLADTVAQLNRLAPLLEQDKGRLDASLQRAPGNFRKLARIASYGSFIQFYLCSMSLRVTDLQGRTAVFPWIKQETGRCTEP